MLPERQRRVGALKSRDEQQHTAKYSRSKPQREYDLRRVRGLNSAFFNRDPRWVARDLLGKVLVRQIGREHIGGRIVEVEAYLGSDDAAAHAAAGLTLRNRVIFGPPGRAYVYFVYGNHYCLNVSCLPEGTAGCVLFRALEPLFGLEMMARRRRLRLLDQKTRRLLTTGPGRLCEALEITRPENNGKDMTAKSSGLWLGDDGFRPPNIATSKRVGITKSAEQQLRYYIDGNDFVSGPKTRGQEAGVRSQ